MTGLCPVSCHTLTISQCNKKSVSLLREPAFSIQKKDEFFFEKKINNAAIKKPKSLPICEKIYLCSSYHIPISHFKRVY